MSKVIGMQNNNVYRAFFLTGCTASGKTAVAHCLARNLDAVILSADSMLVYRGMDIGTAKPTPAERAEIKYYGIDIVEPGEVCNLSVYYKAACSAIREAAVENRTLIVTGGSGLYLNCLLQGLDRRPAANPQLREELEGVLQSGGVPALAALLLAVEPAVYNRMTESDRENPRRLMRALEVARGGHAIESDGLSVAGDVAALSRVPALRLPTAQLHQTISGRVRKMFDAGLLDEVRDLSSNGLLDAPTASQAIGYAEAMDCLQGKCTQAEAIERIALRTRRLAKKQMTWFRNKMRVDWLDVDDGMSLEKRADVVMAYWDEHGPTLVPCHANGPKSQRRF